MIGNGDIVYELKSLENGGSREMAVDGTTPVTFKFQASGTELWWLWGVHFFLLDSGVMAHNTFGSLGAALTNGLRLKIDTIADVIVKDLVDNVDILMAFNKDKLVGSTNTGFLNNDDYFFGAMTFPQPILMRGNNDDKVKILIQDDLSTVDRIRCSTVVSRVL
jgi:hypothetical protein